MSNTYNFMVLPYATSIGAGALLGGGLSAVAPIAPKAVDEYGNVITEEDKKESRLRKIIRGAIYGAALGGITGHGITIARDYKAFNKKAKDTLNEMKADPESAGKKIFGSEEEYQNYLKNHKQARDEYNKTDPENAEWLKKKEAYNAYDRYGGSKSTARKTFEDKYKTVDDLKANVSDYENKFAEAERRRDRAAIDELYKEAVSDLTEAASKFNPDKELKSRVRNIQRKYHPDAKTSLGFMVDLNTADFTIERYVPPVEPPPQPPKDPGPMPNPQAFDKKFADRVQDIDQASAYNQLRYREDIARGNVPAFKKVGKYAKIVGGVGAVVGGGLAAYNQNKHYSELEARQLRAIEAINDPVKRQEVLRLYKEGKKARDFKNMTMTGLNTLGGALTGGYLGAAAGAGVAYHRLGGLANNFDNILNHQRGYTKDYLNETVNDIRNNKAHTDYVERLNAEKAKDVLRTKGDMAGYYGYTFLGAAPMIPLAFNQGETMLKAEQIKDPYEREKYKVERYNEQAKSLPYASIGSIALGVGGGLGIRHLYRKRHGL